MKNFVYVFTNLRRVELEYQVRKEEDRRERYRDREKERNRISGIEKLR